MPSPVTSWDSFWDPAFKGKTALRDTAKTQYIASCLYLGLDFNKPGDDQWDKIEDAMGARAANMRTLWSSGDDLKHFMAQEDVILADCYDGLGVSMHEAQPEVVYATPAEGTPGWYDGPELLARAPHPNAAYAWIDFVTSTAMQLQVAKEVNYAPGNSKVPSLLSGKLLTQLNLKEPKTTLSSLKFHKFVGRRVGTSASPTPGRRRRSNDLFRDDVQRVRPAGRPLQAVRRRPRRILRVVGHQAGRDPHHLGPSGCGKTTTFRMLAGLGRRRAAG